MPTPAKPGVTARLVLAAVLLASCVHAPPSAPQRRPIGALDPALAASIVSAENRARRQVRADTVAEDALLTAAARAFALELAHRGRLTHASHRRGQRTLVQRVRAAGVSPERVAENLAMLSDCERPAEEVVRLWLASRVHRDNVLDGRFSRVGTAVAAGARNTWFVVQVYAGP